MTLCCDIKLGVPEYSSQSLVQGPHHSHDCLKNFESVRHSHLSPFLWSVDKHFVVNMA